MYKNKKKVTQYFNASKSVHDHDCTSSGSSGPTKVEAKRLFSDFCHINLIPDLSCTTL